MKSLFEKKSRSPKQQREVVIEIGYRYKKGRPTYKVILSAEDADLANMRWTPSDLRKDGKVYFIGSIGKKTVRLNRLVLERMLERKLQSSEICDHINTNTLDNRRSNLRVCSHSENSCNRGLPANNTSGMKGVWWRPHIQKWEVRVVSKGKRYYVGVFPSLEEAGAAYNRKAAELHGMFHRPNQLD